MALSGEEIIELLSLWKETMELLIADALYPFIYNILRTVDGRGSKDETLK